MKRSNTFFSSSLFAYTILTLMAFFLACNHVIGRAINDQIPPVGLSFWRWIAGAVFLLPFITKRWRYTLNIYRKEIASLTLLGTLMTGSTTLVLVALHDTSAINVSLLNAMQPALTLFFAWLFLNEFIGKQKIIGVALAFTGVVAMISQGNWQLTTSLDFNRGDLIALLAMTGFSAYAINIKKVPTTLTAAESLFGIIIMGSLVLLPFYLIESAVYQPVPLQLSTAAVVVALALLVSLLGMLMWNKGNQIIGPSRAAIFMNLIPVFGTSLAIPLLNEKLHVFHLAGAGLIGLGVLLSVTEKTTSRIAPAMQPIANETTPER